MSLVALAVLAAVLPGGGEAQLGLFEKNHPLVEQGMEAYEKGDYSKALERFEAAQRELPKSARLQFNRGNALYKLGRFDEAGEAYRRASEAERGELGARDLYNLGNALASLEKNAEAIASYRKALVENPKDELARHNLEVLLRKLPPPKSSGPDGGTPDGGEDAGRDGGQDGGQDGGRGDGGSSDGGSDGGSWAQSSQGAPDGGADGGSESTPEAAPQQPLDGGVELSKKDVEKLLDSMKNNEKNLQLWRFQQKRQKRPNGKDW